MIMGNFTIFKPLRFIATVFSVVMMMVSSLQAQVNVVATAGTPTGTYATVSAAFAAINLGTHQGVVDLTISANTTEPAAVVALLASGGTSNYTAINIKPSGNVTVNSAASTITNRGLIELNGADNVTIDGDDPATPGVRNLTFQVATSASTTIITAVIRISSSNTLGTGGANNNTVKNCVIIGSRSSGIQTTMSYGINASNYSTTSLSTGAYGNLNTTIDNNEIRRCYRGIHLNGASTTIPNTGIYVTNNIIGSATLADNVGQNGIFVSYSNITGGTTTSLIEGNDVRCGDVSATGSGFSSTVSGIDLGTVNSGIRVLRNNIHDVMQPTTGGYGAYGINISGAAQCDNFLIANNMINNIVASRYSTSATTTFIATGLRFSGGATNARVINNTILVSAATNGITANYAQHGVYLVSTMTFAQFLNNIVVNNGVGSGSYAIYSANIANISTAAVNNNNYSAPAGIIGFYNALPQATLANWQVATGKDINSFNVAPNFVSVNDLHITTAPTPLESAGAPVGVTLVTNDIDNQLRPGPVGSVNGGASNPDIGADEFDATPIFAPVLTFGSITPYNCATATSHPVVVNVTPGSGTIASVVLGYSFNGVAQAPITMTNTSGTTYEATIPVATPVNAVVTWGIVATNSFGLLVPYTGATYQDQSLLGITAFATNSGALICAGTSTGLSAILSGGLAPTQASTLYTTPVVNNALADEDLGNVTITDVASSTVLLNNSTTINTGAGTIGTATGTLGSYSDFTSFGPYTMNAGSAYSFSLTSLTLSPTNFYNNSMAIFIDYNRNGSFTDAGEVAYAAGATALGPHTETGFFTIPATAFNGLTRMRVVCIEGLMPTYVSPIGYGEYEDYMLNIVSSIPGGGVPPAITSVSWSSTTVTGLATGNPATINPIVNDDYVGTVTSLGCTVNSSPTTVNVLALPTAPIATNSSQCGTSVPLASVASGAGAAGNGQFYWYGSANGSNLLQSPPTGAYTTFYTNDFANLTIGAGATLSGVASLSATPGQLQITPNSTSQLGGITVDAGINAQVYKVDFDVTTSPVGGADGFSYSFASDVNAASTVPTAEKGSGSKLKISFDAYDNVMPNQAGIYLLYNNTAATFNATTPGVLAYVPNTSWVGSANNHVTIDINAQGGVTLTLNGTVIMNNIALPSSYINENKATWKHAIAGRTGGIAMQMLFDNLVIQTASQVAGSTTYGTALSANTTLYVSEAGTNGCLSATSPVVITVSQPDPISITSGLTPGICFGQPFTTTASSTANPAYAYTWDIASYTGSGISAPVTGSVLSTTPTVAGVYPFTVTGTNGICTEIKTVNLTVNALPVITSATATPLTACHNATVDLTASSIVSGPQTLPAGYCTTNNFGGGLFNQVIFGTINNNSTATNPTATPYYTNYTATTDVQPGQTLPLTVVNGTSATIISVWIDYNRDGQLTASEWQQVALAAAVGATVTINVTIPANAQMGLTKMRIRSRLSGNPNGSGDACTSLGSGETEDYLVNIQSQPAIPYTYSWNATPVVNTMNGTTVATNTTAAPITQSWTITAVEAATGCVNSLATAPITIQPAFLTPIAVNSTHCGVQVPTASVSDPNAFTTPTYNWYATSALGTALQSTTANTYAATIGTTSTLYVTTTNPSTGCQSDAAPVLVTVAAAPALTLSASTATNCSDLPSALVTLVDGSTSFDSYTWTNTATVAGTPTAGYTFNPANATANAPAITTTYLLTAVQTAGQLCQNQATVVVTTNSLPMINSTVANPTAVCSGGTVNLSAASSTLTPVTGIPGPPSTGANTSFSYPSPFGGYYWGAKQQFLYTAAELTAAGFAAGNITSLAFDVTGPVTSPLADYTISMKNTTVTALTTTFETGLSTVFYSPSYVPSALTGFANNTFNLTPFAWNGTSNVVIEICFNNSAYTNNAVATWTAAFTGAAHFYNADAAGVCAATTIGTVTNNRPMIQMGGTTGTNYTPTLAWSWPSLNQNGTTASTVVSNPGTTNTTATYTVQATNTTTGCSVSNTTAPVTIWALPTINAGADILICSNNATEQATVTATGAGATGSYAWTSPVAGVQNALPFAVGASGTFSVIGTDGNGCINYDTLALTYSTIPVAAAGVDQAICFGETTSFTANGLAPFTWSMTSYNGSGISAPVLSGNLTVTPTVPGTYVYNVGVANSVGCTNDDQVQLTVWALPIVNAGVDQTICNASPAILSGSGALTYTWTNNVTNATPFFPSSTASYTVDGVDINGCHNFDNVSVTVLPQPIVNGGIDQTICATTPAILFAQTTANTPTAVTGFQWNNSVTNGQQFTPTATATYTVTATGANGCTNQDQVVVNVLALPTVNAGNDITVCAGLSATLNATGAASYSWNNGITQAIPFYPNATTTYTVVGTGANGCTNQDQVVVNVSTGPNVSVTGAQIVCANAPATLSAASTNSMGGFWTTSNGLGTISPNVSNGTVTYTPTSNDPVVVNLTYVASNACGNVSQSTSVTVLPIPTVNAGPDIASCSGLPVTLSATSNGFITWNNNVSNNVAFVPGSSATYTVTAVGANNCTNSDQMLLTVLALPDVNAGADQTICSGSSATLNGSGANTYLWNNGVVNNVAFAPTTTQTYTVTGTALNGCQSSDQVLVTVNATPVALVSIVDDVTIAASPAGMNYQWINCASGTDIPTATAAQFTAAANGSYAVIVTSLQGCEDVSDCIDINSVGLDQINISDINVFPNPTNGEVNVTMSENMMVDVQIFDAQGKLVAEQMNVTNNGKLNISNVTPGVYMVRLTAENAVQTFRVVKN
jgi:hypothetical protein